MIALAGRIPEEFINEVRRNVNIVDIISQYVALEKKGKDYLGLCPFHQEKTPSFTVNEEKQFFKCFGCGKGGNVFKFLMEQEKLTFPESVSRVADFAHIPMPAGYGETTRVLNPLMQVQQAAADFYHRVLLTTKVGQRGLAYAKSRALSEEIIDHFQIGYAPKGEQILLSYLTGQNFSEELLAKSGLFVESQSGKLFDRFRDRLMFPLANESGQVIGFSGRRLSTDKTEAKYMNSPETEIFSKSKVLFHFSEARQAAKTENHLVLYEGYMDVIAGYKAGVKAGIASMGTSLTDNQVYLLRRVTPNIIINYDGDDPGVHAEERAVKMFNQAGGFNIGIVVLPEKLDPDEFVQKYGPQKYLLQIQGALTPTDFFLRQLKQKYNLDNDREKLMYVDEALAGVAQLTNPVEQDLYVDKLAQQLGVSRESLKASLLHQRRKTKRSQQHTATQPSVPAEIPLEGQATVKTDPVQDRLLYLFMHSDQARDYLMKQNFLFPSAEYARIEELWLNYSEKHENPTTNGFIDFIPSELQGIIVNVEMAGMLADFSEKELDEQIHALAIRKVSHEIEQQLQALAEAKSQQDVEAMVKITNRILELKRLQG